MRLRRHLRLTPRGRDVITHLLRMRTGQLSRGNAAISLSAISYENKEKRKKITVNQQFILTMTVTKYHTLKWVRETKL